MFVAKKVKNWYIQLVVLVKYTVTVSIDRWPNSASSASKVIEIASTTLAQNLCSNKKMDWFTFTWVGSSIFSRRVVSVLNSVRLLNSQQPDRN